MLLLSRRLKSWITSPRCWRRGHLCMMERQPPTDELTKRTALTCGNCLLRRKANSGVWLLCFESAKRLRNRWRGWKRKWQLVVADRTCCMSSSHTRKQQRKSSQLSMLSNLGKKLMLGESNGCFEQGVSRKKLRSGTRKKHDPQRVRTAVHGQQIDCESSSTSLFVYRLRWKMLAMVDWIYKCTHYEPAGNGSRPRSREM
mmetsp:Transcript_23796/g.57706  ORF Transcript_23796/g.57706 Transcript_23796/m.57706 type:complete len:200 (+) Transcript_23796:1084-1683(+)